MSLYKLHLKKLEELEKDLINLEVKKEMNLKLNNLNIGDCHKLLKLIPDNSVDLILTDPPYGTTNAKTDKSLNWNEIWIELKRIRKNEKTPIVLFSEGLFVVDLINSNRKEYKYKWIVNKIYKTNFLNAKRQPLRQFDEVLVFGAKMPNYYPQMSLGKPNHSQGKNINRTNNNYNLFKRNENEKLDGLKYPSNILTIDYHHPSVRNHHQEKPLELLEYFLKTYSKEGDIVLDFTAGSANILLAGKKLNRKIIAIEMEKEWKEIIEKKLLEN